MQHHPTSNVHALPQSQHDMERTASEEEPLLPDSARLRGEEWLKDNIKQYRLGSCYVGFCVTITCLCLAHMTYSLLLQPAGTAGRRRRESVLLVIELLVTVFIITELVLDAYLKGCRKFWTSCWSWLDLAVGFGCIWSLATCYQSWEQDKNCAEYLGVAGVTLRYVLQAIRVIWLIRAARRAKEERDTVEETFIALPGQPES